MHPTLLRFGSFEIHTYGVLVAIGFLVGLLTAARRAKSAGIDPERINDLGVWLVVAGMAGGKLFHILFFWNDFIRHWPAARPPALRGGLVFSGGLSFAAPAAEPLT